MSNGRFAVIAAAVIAIIVAIGLTAGGGSDNKSGGGGTSSKPSKDAVVVDFAYSPEKEVLIASLIKDFNDRRVKVSGAPVFVRPQIISSGDAQRKIAAKTLRPVAWSPSSSLWGRLLNFQADTAYVADDNPSIVRTPLLIAMWEPLARALGWPKKQVGFNQVLSLAVDKRGWASYGKPQYGQFKLGHTNPDFSTSGLSAVAAEYYTAANKLEGLTEQDVTSTAVRDKIRAIEQSIVHYGDTTLFFADQLKRYGPAYASAVAMEEATLIDYNLHRGSAAKLVGLYPKEGTFYSDDPFIVLNAPWVDANERAGAEAFEKFLAEKITPAVASKAGFRPGDPDARPTAPIDAAHGADPALPTRVLGLPQPAVLAKIKSAWRQDRKPANVILAVDVSGSMSEEGKLEEAKRGLQTFFKQLSPRDRIGLLSFNDQVFPLVTLGEFAKTGPDLRAQVRDLVPGGETAWLDATARAVQSVDSLKDMTRINAVVVLTDGEDTASRLREDDLRQALARQARIEGKAIRVYTIAYGSQANQTQLQQVAASSGGKSFKGDPKDIESVYLSISSFF